MNAHSDAPVKWTHVVSLNKIEKIRNVIQLMAHKTILFIQQMNYQCLLHKSEQKTCVISIIMNF